MYRDDATLTDIWHCAHNILRYVDGLDYDTFINDDKTVHAVLHQIMVMGEAVKRLSADFREKQVQVPWKKIAGMRDKLIHFYDGVDNEQVWVTVQEQIPALIAQLEPLIPDPPKE